MLRGSGVTAIKIGCNDVLDALHVTQWRTGREIFCEIARQKGLDENALAERLTIASGFYIYLKKLHRYGLVEDRWKAMPPEERARRTWAHSTPSANGYREWRLTGAGLRERVSGKEGQVEGLLHLVPSES